KSDEEDVPCAECKVLIFEGDQALECDCCDHWYCYGCSKVPNKRTYDTVASSKEGDGIMWFCPHCRLSLPGMQKMLIRVSKLEQGQNEILEKLEAIQNKDKVRIPRESNVEDIVRDEKKKKKEIEYRKLNVMCFGVGESNAGTANERRDEDEAQMKEIIADVLDGSEMQTEKPIRIGKFIENPTGNKVRPVKLVFQSFEDKKSLLKSAIEKVNKSKEGKYKNIYFQSDLTQKQREEAFLKRQQRRNIHNSENQKRASDAQRQMTDNRRDLNRTEQTSSQSGMGDPPGDPREDSFRH
ncbi:MAG: hypothetical protein ABW185_18680, partial [Sedimenticola sp.]